MRIYIFQFFFFFMVINIYSQSKITINPDVQKRGKLILSDIIESIEYIPIETNNRCLISTISDNRSFVMTSNHILIHCKKNNIIYLFNRKGQFVSQISKEGKGPGEFLKYTIQLLKIDEVNKQIITYTSYPKRLMYFNFEGQFIKSIPIESKQYIDFLLSIDDRYLNLSANDGMRKIPYTYGVFSSEFELIHQKIKPIQIVSNKPRTGVIVGGTPFSYYFYNGNLHIREVVLNDTLYVVDSKKYTFIPKYCINAGKYEFSVDVLIDSDHFLSRQENYLSVNSIFETQKYLFLSYYFQNKNFFCYYDKTEGKILHFNSHSGISNDFDGGLDFWPQYQYNNQLIAFYDAYLFEENINNPRKMEPKGTQEAIKRLDKLTNNLDPEANPVMVIVTLKQ